MRWSPRLAMALIVLLATACTPSSEPPAPEPGNDPEPSNGSVDTTTNPAQPSDEPALPREDELAAIWTEFLAAWFDQAAAEQPDPAAFEDLTVDPDETIEALTRQRGDARLATVEFEPWTTIDTADDRAQISDCVIVAQHPDDQSDSLATVTISWEATAIATEDGWLIDTARPGELFCIAEELNDHLLGAYEDFRLAKDAAWDPPDPDHPELARTMTGDQLEFIRDLLAEHQQDGIVVRDPAPTDNAVVFEIGIGQATVSDCTVQVPERGAFDLATGDRLDDLIPPPRVGQLDLQSVELERQDNGSWRVVDQAGTRDTNCVPGSTRYAVS